MVSALTPAESDGSPGCCLLFSTQHLQGTCSACRPQPAPLLQCNATGDKCTVCNGNRMSINGVCNLPCKQL